MTYWGRFKKDQSFVQYPATRHDVYKSRMEEKFSETKKMPERTIKILAEENEEKAEQAMEKAKGGFWQAVANIFSKEKKTEPVKNAKWPANAKKQ